MQRIKKQSLEVFMELASVVQTHRSDDFFVDALKCEKGVKLLV